MVPLFREQRVARLHVLRMSIHAPPGSMLPSPAMHLHLLGLRRLAVAALVAFTMSLTACDGCSKKADKPESTTSGEQPAAAGSAATNSGQPGFPDVCKMFTNEELSALTGSQITTSRPGEKSTAAEPECDWLNANEGIVVTVGLSVAAKDLSFEGYEPVAGIGESAAENHGILSVLSKGTEITVIHGGSGSVDVQKKIAAKVIAELEKAKKSH